MGHRRWWAIGLLAAVVLAGCGSSNVGSPAQTASEPTASDAAASDVPMLAGVVDDQHRLTKSVTVTTPGALQLDPAPTSVTPTVSAAEALQEVTRSSRYPGHDPVLVLSDVTSVGWGTPGADGSFQPAVDHQLAWILWYTDVELRVIGGVADPTGTATTTTIPLRGEAIVLIDATTGQELSTMEGG